MIRKVDFSHLVKAAIITLTLASNAYSAESKIDQKTKALLSPLNNWTFKYPYDNSYPNILEYSSSNNQGIYYFNQPMEKILNKIKDERGTITVDCKIFVQIVYQSAKHRKNNFELSYGGNPRILELSSYLSIDKKTFKETFEAAQNLPSHNKGIWLIPLKNNMYLGLSDDGPKIQNCLKWKEEIIRNLNQEAEMLTTEKSQSQQSKNRGRLIKRFLAKHPEITDPENWLLHGKETTLLEFSQLQSELYKTETKPLSPSYP